MSVRKKIFFILLAGLVLRLALVIFLPYPFYPVKIDDARGYDLLAWNMLNGNGFSQMSAPPYKPDIIRTPGYPFFLAMVYLIFGHSYFMVRLIQAIIDVGTCFLAYLISRHLFSDKDKETVSNLVLFLSLIAPPLAFLVSALYTETLSAFLITLSTYFAIRAHESGRLRFYLLSALAIGYAILVRPVFLFIPLISALILMSKNSFHKMRLTLSYLAIAGLMIVPWTTRNFIVFHKFIPLAMGVKLGLYKATWQPVKTESDLPDKVPLEELKAFSDFILIPMEVSRKSGEEIIKEENELGKAAIAKIRGNIPRYLWLSLQRLPQLWVSSYSHFIRLDTPAGKLISEIKSGYLYKNKHLDFSKISTIALKIGLSALNSLYLFFGILGIIALLIVRNKRIILSLLPILYISFLLPPFGHSLARYTVPAWPLFIVFTGYGLVFALKKANFL